MIRARLSVEGFALASRELSVKGERARRVDVVLGSHRVRREFEEASQRRFKRGLPRAKRGWTIEKQRRGLDSRSMRATGAAEAALTRGAGPLGREVIFEANRGVVRFGVHRGRTGLYYLNALARGYPTTHGRVRPRRVVFIDKLVRENVTAYVLRYVDSGGMS
jgi:hypothetical protein